MKKIFHKKSCSPRAVNLLLRQEILESLVYVINDIKAWLIPLFIDKASYLVNKSHYREEILWGPNTRIEYHRIYDAYSNIPATVFAKLSTKNGSPIWVTWMFVSNVSITLTVFDKHFFIRYAERMGNKYSYPLITDFLSNHLILYFWPNQSPGSSSEDVICPIPEGYILGQRIGANVVLAKTFITKAMAAPSQQQFTVITTEKKGDDL